MFKSHLEMIGRNESPTKKAKFWQSYVRSLKGSEDIRAHEAPRIGRPYSSYLDAPHAYRSIFDEPATANERVQSSGYRYLPVSRDTYGYSPRAIYDHHYSRTIPANYDAERAWNDHLKRMQEIERRYPSRYGLYLKDKPHAPNAMVPLEYEPEDKLLQELNKERFTPAPSRPYRYKRAGSEPYVPPPAYWNRDSSVPRASTRAPSVFDRATSLAPFTRPLFRASSLEPLDELFASKLDGNNNNASNDRNSRAPSIFERAGSPSPTPVKAGRWGPRPTEVAYDAEGLPIFHPRNRYRDMLEPNPNAPISAFTRDPFWWDVDDLMPLRSLSVPRGVSPFRSLSVPRGSSPVARDSFLSPVKNRYLWSKHPHRPLTPHRTIA